MATYLLVNLLFMALVVLLLRIRPRMPSRNWWILLTVLLVLTAVFDSMIVYFEVVGYDASKLLGVYVGYAPIEDFFYAILAAVLVPWAWNRFGAKK